MNCVMDLKTFMDIIIFETNRAEQLAYSKYCCCCYCCCNCHCCHYCCCGNSDSGKGRTKKEADSNTESVNNENNIENSGNIGLNNCFRNNSVCGWHDYFNKFMNDINFNNNAAEVYKSCGKKHE
jgi:hypothetical protein